MTYAKAISVAEVFHNKPRPVEVPDEQQMTISHEDEGCRAGLFQVEARSIADLQALSLVPREVDERLLRKAIADDDADTLALARTRMESSRSAEPGCSCHEQAPTHQQARTYQQPLRTEHRTELRAVYNGMRRFNNVRLSQVLSESTRAHVAFDSIEASIARGFASRAISGSRIIIGLFQAEDIIIGANSTLAVPATTKLLLANDVRIFRGGVLRGLGSFLKITCASIQGNLMRITTGVTQTGTVAVGRG